MTVKELLQPLDKYRIQYVKIHAGNEIYIYNFTHLDKLDEIYRWFGKCTVKSWRADLGDSLYIEI